MNEVENLKLSAGASKAPIGIVPMHALYGVARVLEDSGVKYAPGNFMSQPVSDACASYDSAQLRHRIECSNLSGLVDPTSYAALDDDSGLPHIDHMIAGLLILRTLMIRDGMLPRDPGQGKRKIASKIATASDAGYRAGGQPVLDDMRYVGVLDAMRPELLVGYAAPELVGLAAREALVVESSYHLGTFPGDPPADDPDAERRAATERNLRELQEQQRRDAAAKAERDRMMATNGRARAEGVNL